jgi:hypothetical protein
MLLKENILSTDSFGWNYRPTALTGMAIGWDLQCSGRISKRKIPQIAGNQAPVVHSFASQFTDQAILAIINEYGKILWHTMTHITNWKNVRQPTAGNRALFCSVNIPHDTQEQDRNGVGTYLILLSDESRKSWKSSGLNTSLLIFHISVEVFQFLYVHYL